MIAHNDADNIGLNRSLIFLITFSCGQAVANLYYAQPLLHMLAKTFSIHSGSAGLIVTATQIGYALGLVFIVPLGDKKNRQKLIPTVALLSALGLALQGFSPNYPIFVAASLITGLTSVVAMLLVPFAASLTHGHARGKVVGTIMSGVLIGILLARTISGSLANLIGWRSMFLIAAAGMLIQALILQRKLPIPIPTVIPEKTTYRELVLSAFQLLKKDRTLLFRTLYGGLMFATFGTLWTCLPFLLSTSPYSLSTSEIGLFGLLGAAGASSAKLAGRLTDKGNANIATLIFMLCVLGAFVSMLIGQYSLIVIVLGVAWMDFGMQGEHVTNQGVIYRLQENAHSRITTAYMTVFFLGGALGSSLSAFCYQITGWTGACLFAIGLTILAIGIWVFENLTRKATNPVIQGEEG